MFASDELINTTSAASRKWRFGQLRKVGGELLAHLSRMSLVFLCQTVLPM